jgi:hypothetical protein
MTALSGAQPVRAAAIRDQYGTRRPSPRVPGDARVSRGFLSPCAPTLREASTNCAGCSRFKPRAVPTQYRSLPVIDATVLSWPRGVYRNDRQVREKHVFHGIDRANPRAEVTVEPLQAQQAALIDDEPKGQPETAAMDF